MGSDLTFPIFGDRKRVVYADWTASGRLYQPIENYMSQVVGPFVANTHTETTLTGKMMTHLYAEAHEIVKRHVNATNDDLLVFCGFGQTSAVNKFQRILNLRFPKQLGLESKLATTDKPLVIISHMEHHSNQISWEECFCDVRIVARDPHGLPDLKDLRRILNENHDRKCKFGSFTACSNVTGIITPIHEMAELMHEFGGYCFVDYAASAPYVKIDMHPPEKSQQLDAIYFSPHKFLGGPGASGVLLFNRSLYANEVPDQPGGGTVKWTNPWGMHRYLDDIEAREDGGTPGFLQAMRAALAVLLKEAMGVERIAKREEELRCLLWRMLESIGPIEILEKQQQHRLGIVSFYTLKHHYNLIVKLLNDRFGIQTRGGCSCAGTYGHLLFGIGLARSQEITSKIDTGDLSEKPGWVRISLHPTMTDEEVNFIGNSVKEVIERYDEWKADYNFNCNSGEFEHKSMGEQEYLRLVDAFVPHPSSKCD